MFFEKNIANFFNKKKEIIPEMKIVIKMRIREFDSREPIIFFIATAAPVLVFEMVYREIKENPMTRVFVAPSKTKKPFLSDFEIVFPIIAAWPEPNPGRKLHRGDAIKEANIGL